MIGMDLCNDQGPRRAPCDRQVPLESRPRLARLLSSGAARVALRGREMLGCAYGDGASALDGR